MATAAMIRPTREAPHECNDEEGRAAPAGIPAPAAGTPAATPALLRDYIAGFARREGYHLDDVLIGVEGTTDTRTVAALLDRVRSTGTTTVLVAGPSRTALAALHRLTGVRVLTLADVSPSEPGARR